MRMRRRTRAPTLEAEAAEVGEGTRDRLRPVIRARAFARAAYRQPAGGGAAWNPGLCECWLPTGGTPIIIDTDGSGFHLTSAKDGVSFNFYGDGKPVQTAWTVRGSTNGWLALDRNGNGQIDNAQELFGNVTPQPFSIDPNGFRALAVFDAPENGGNGDGKIDEHDSVWPKLLVWIDSNHDGISQPEELHHLDELGISSIDLGYRLSQFTDQFGNRFRYRGRLNIEHAVEVDQTIYDVLLKQTLYPASSSSWSLDNALKSKANNAFLFLGISTSAARGSRLVECGVSR
jgi:hypothetical protein